MLLCSPSPSTPPRPHRESWWRQQGKLGSVERWLANPVRRKSGSCHSTASPQGSYRRSADSLWKESHPVVLQQEEVGFDTKFIGWVRWKRGEGASGLHVGFCLPLPHEEVEEECISSPNCFQLACPFWPLHQAVLYLSHSPPFKI